MEKKIVCQRCIYYFVTWEPSQPHGCKSYGFKSRFVPSIVVKNSSGQTCNFFVEKNIKE